ncbi:glycosyltransferase family 39 protein [Magnetospirillum gryphiswaldense]|uniref:Uncharacterized protein n=1 Tax=Magnetospirillum gryphiswaldense TaxID=55518 RepID=A4U167_9PROT|nr:glycosyltransferase family 39 protein [Magnetospirillum gryphiswaldense]AVM75595.1 hypothetical protein MSR1_31290 [Magnetospirillum gryphiswaldense MSR-1]AVM79498.1 hypothetical protein MSR1L_31290 [Magnetospirillum gryphiswaldense]CAM76624.1 conserved hypothetical protein, membrane [Magnetospirillum gryphiswaldense MSR-1]
MGIFAALVLTAILIFSTRPLILFLDGERRLSPVVLACLSFALGWVVLYLLVFVVGRFSLDAKVLAAAITVLGFAALWGLRTVPWAAVETGIAAAVQFVRRNPLTASLALVPAAMVLSGVVQGLAPPNDYDSLMYHLSIPKLDVELGRIVEPWQRALPHGFFPQMTGNIYRLFLGLGVETAIQPFNGIVAALTALLCLDMARKCQMSVRLQIVAVTAYVACRVVVWEMATPEVEIPLAFFTVLAVLLLWTWSETPRPGLALLLGLVLGAGSLVKFHGFVVAAIVGIGMIMVVARHIRLASSLAWAAGGGLAVITPHLVVSYLISGNPLYPMFNHLFTPGGADYFAGTAAAYGIGRDPLSLLATPWALSVQPMQHFDGMVLGSPYFLALAPLGLLFGRRQARLPVLWAPVLAYYVVWFYALSQQVRFLMPILPVLAVWTAMGVEALLAACGRNRLLHAVTALMLTVMAANQGLFVAIYAALRLPPALGLTSAVDFHSKTPTMTGAFYQPCLWLRDNLAPTERVLALVTPYSYYCPQAAGITLVFPGEEKSWNVTGAPPPLGRDAFIDKMAAANVRWIMYPTAFENRRNDSGVPVLIPVDMSEHRLGRYLQDVVATLQPVRTDAFLAIYDARDVLRLLQNQR